MANRRISELQEQAGLQLDEDDLLTVVHVAEVDPAIKNKKLTISGTKAYLNVYYLPRTGGTISGSVVVQDNLTVSGTTTLDSLDTTGTSTVNALIVKTNATVTGTVSGATITGNFIKATNITGQLISGVNVSGTTSTFSTGTYTRLTGVTTTGTSAQFTSITEVFLSFPLKAITPSFAFLVIFFDAFEIPLTLKISAAFSRSPLDSLMAALQSLNPAPVDFLRFFILSKSLIL